MQTLTSVHLTIVSIGLSVLFSPLPAFYVVGGELGEQWHHVAARGSQSRVQHRGDGHLYHGSAGMQDHDETRWWQVKNARVAENSR